MKIISTKKLMNGKNENGDPYTLRLEMPNSQEENAVSDKLNMFYSELAKKLESDASAYSLVIVSELHITLCTDKESSFFIDILYYKNGSLVKYLRISDNRDDLGNEIVLPKFLRKKNHGADGFYRDADNYYIYKNVFTLGAEKDIRRSDYGKTFVNTEKIPI